MRGLKAGPGSEPGADAPEGYAVLLENVTKTYGAAKGRAEPAAVAPAGGSGSTAAPVLALRRSTG